jgi:riboflavin kinase/FMN adenylyltransferase
MKLIENLDEINAPFPGAVITIGNFDGVHIGHQALFHEVVEKAEEIGGTSVAMTFDPHPLRALKQNGHLPLITLKEQKVELIESSGIEVLVVAPFTEAFASLTARQFVEDLLVGRIGVQAMVVGPDYRFGKGREGDLSLLRRYADELSFELIVSDWIRAARAKGNRTSSTRIREAVEAGRMAEARKMLGRSYQIRGVVTSGRDRGGKLLGFPTANITLQDELCPKNGVYAVTVECLGRFLPGVANIGYSPTFSDHLFTVEVHILEFDENVYGEAIRVNFVERIRDEIRFPSIEELKAQIARDIETARHIFERAPDSLPAAFDG